MFNFSLNFDSENYEINIDYLSLNENKIFKNSKIIESKLEKQLEDSEDEEMSFE